VHGYGHNGEFYSPWNSEAGLSGQITTSGQENKTGCELKASKHNSKQ